MINLLLVFLMIAALSGMLWCNRRRTPGNRSASQIIAFLLLLLVLISGGIFVARLGSLPLPGRGTAAPAENSLQFQEAQGVVVGSWMARQFPDEEILLLTDETHPKKAALLLSGLRQGGIKNLTHVMLAEDAVPEGEDPLVLPEDAGISAAQIDQAVARYPECRAVVIACVPSSGEPLLQLQYLKRPASRRPATVVLGVGNPESWFQERIQSGEISAMVVPDLSKLGEELPQNADAKTLFRSRYVLITKGNLHRNRRFFQ